MKIPEGWKRVPVEPTPEMVEAGMNSTGDQLNGRPVWKATLDEQAAHIYRAMLDAAPTPPATHNDAGYTEGIQSVATMLERKADAFAEEFGHDDMGGLSFGRGREAEAKADYHQSLLELADEVRAMPIAPAPTPPAQDDEALQIIRDLIADLEHIGGDGWMTGQVHSNEYNAARAFLIKRGAA